MNKVKINTGLAAIVLLGGFVAGWSTLLIVVALMLLFCELTDAIKNVMIKVIVFLLAITLFDTAWALINDGIGLIIGSFDKIIAIINNYLSEPLNTYKLNAYLLEPINSVVSLLDEVIIYLVYFVKFTFVIAVLGNKPMKENFIVKKVNDFVNKAILYINSFDLNAGVNQQPTYGVVQGTQPVMNNMPQPTGQMPQQVVQQQNINQ